MTNFVVARLAREAEIRNAYNAINTETLFVYMQKFPGVPEHDNRGIQGLTYRVLWDGTQVRQGQTAADGKIEVRFAPGRNVILQVLGTEYQISKMATLHPHPQIRGVQQRLEMLGYHIGPLHGDDHGASTFRNPDLKTEIAMLDLQADQGLFADAKFGNNSQIKLRDAVQGAGGE